MPAANTILENGGRVVLLDKSFFCGGTSTHPEGGELRMTRAKSGKTLAKAHFDFDGQIVRETWVWKRMTQRTIW